MRLVKGHQLNVRDVEKVKQMKVMNNLDFVFPRKPRVLDSVLQKRSYDVL